jgi:hypothetical protein
MAYSDLLKDPRWQKKRLKIFERDKFRCTECGCEQNTLHVHHIKYSGKPWEAPDYLLVTLCESCHAFEEDLKSEPMICKLSMAIEITRIKVWKSAMMFCYLKNNAPSDFDQVKRILNSNCYDNGNGKNFTEFVIEVYNGK